MFSLWDQLFGFSVDRCQLENLDKNEKYIPYLSYHWGEWANCTYLRDMPTLRELFSDPAFCEAVDECVKEIIIDDIPCGPLKPCITISASKVTGLADFIDSVVDLSELENAIGLLQGEAHVPATMSGDNYIAVATSGTDNQTFVLSFLPSALISTDPDNTITVGVDWNLYVAPGSVPKMPGFTSVWTYGAMEAQEGLVVWHMTHINKGADQGFYVLNGDGSWVIVSKGTTFDCDDLEYCILNNASTQNAIKNFVESNSFDITGTWKFKWPVIFDDNIVSYTDATINSIGSTWNFDSASILNLNGSTINADWITSNSENSAYNYVNDAINYDQDSSINYDWSTVNSNWATHGYNGSTIDYDANTTINNAGTTNNSGTINNDGVTSNSENSTYNSENDTYNYENWTINYDANTEINGGVFNGSTLNNVTINGLTISPGDLNGSDIGYDNSGSGATATTVQGAIDELFAALNHKEDKINKKTNLSSNSDTHYPTVKAVNTELQKYIKSVSSGEPTGFTSGIKNLGFISEADYDAAVLAGETISTTMYFITTI